MQKYDRCLPVMSPPHESYEFVDSISILKGIGCQLMLELYRWLQYGTVASPFKTEEKRLKVMNES